MAEYLGTNKKKITAPYFSEMKEAGEKITMLTSYDYTMASIIDAAGVDSILVGDSASNVAAGYDTTLPITLTDMIYHASAVARAVKHALVICDMPFGSYQISREQSVANAVRIMKESGVDAVKLEGGIEIIDTIKGIINAGIPVCGHLGLTPQSVHKFGGYGLRANNTQEAEKLISDAIALADAGCFAIVLEKVPAALAAEISHRVDCPTIGIGAGNGTDGQVLVYADMLGMNKGFKPKFLRQYADLHEIITGAVGRYIDDVKSTDFPNESESY
ncbi:MAG: 3-methyl-2-oxobutanoate hydroxymethyltransferase [Prevotella sp.]